jgi:hypothetical protein
MSNPPLVVQIGGGTWTIPQDDGYEKAIGVFALQIQAVEPDINTMSAQVAADANDLNAVNSMSTWQVSDWNNAQTALDRTTALINMGFIPARDSTMSSADTQAWNTNAVFNANGSNIFGDPAVPGAPGLIVAPNPAFLAPAYATFPGTNGQPAPNLTKNTLYHDPGLLTDFYVDSNGNAWLTSNHFEQFYLPTSSQISTWQQQAQTLTTKYSQQSTTDQAALKELITTLQTAQSAVANVTQTRTSAVSAVAKNIAG